MNDECATISVPQTNKCMLRPTYVYIRTQTGEFYVHSIVFLPFSFLLCQMRLCVCMYKNIKQYKTKPDLFLSSN